MLIAPQQDSDYGRLYFLCLLRYTLVILLSLDDSQPSITIFRRKAGGVSQAGENPRLLELEAGRLPCQ